MKTVLGLVLIGGGAIAAGAGLVGFVLRWIDPTNAADDANSTGTPPSWFACLVPLLLGLVIALVGARLFGKGRDPVEKRRVVPKAGE